MAQKYYFEWEQSPLKDRDEETILAVLEDYNNTDLTLKDIDEIYPWIGYSKISRSIPYQLSEEECEHCKTPIYTRIKRIGKSLKTLKLCMNCKHDYTNKCMCEHCIIQRKEEKLLEIELAKRSWEIVFKGQLSLSNTVEDLSVFEMIEVYLAIYLFRSNSKGDGLILQTNSGWHARFSLTNNITNKRIRGNNDVSEAPEEIKNSIVALADRSLIIPDYTIFNNKLVSDQSELGLIQYGVTVPDIHWILNIRNADGELMNANEFLEYVNNYEYSEEEKIGLWENLYLEDLYNFLGHHAYNYKIYNYRDEVIDMISRECYEHFSLSDAYSLVFSLISSSLKYIKKYNPSTKSIQTQLQNKAFELIERFKEGGVWKPFNRISNVPLSLFNTYVINKVLQLPKQTYFYEKPDSVVNFIQTGEFKKDEEKVDEEE